MPARRVGSLPHGTALLIDGRVVHVAVDVSGMLKLRP